MYAFIIMSISSIMIIIDIKNVAKMLVMLLSLHMIWSSMRVLFLLFSCINL